jgi:hypothetical protein
VHIDNAGCYFVIQIKFRPALSEVSGISVDAVTKRRQLERARMLGQLVGRGSKKRINKHYTHLQLGSES